MSTTTTDNARAFGPWRPCPAPRVEALALLQQLYPDGAYSDEESEQRGRRPCGADGAIWAAAALIEEGHDRQTVADLLRLVAEWAQLAPEAGGWGLDR